MLKMFILALRIKSEISLKVWEDLWTELCGTTFKQKAHFKSFSLELLVEEIMSLRFGKCSSIMDFLSYALCLAWISRILRSLTPLMILNWLQRAWRIGTKRDGLYFGLFCSLEFWILGFASCFTSCFSLTYPTCT